MIVSSSVEYIELGSVMVINVSVYDFFVVKVDDIYYIFGLYFVVVKLIDFLNWEMILSFLVNEVVNESLLFDYNYIGEIVEGIEWIDGFIGNWVVDVI